MYGTMAIDGITITHSEVNDAVFKSSTKSFNGWFYIPLDHSWAVLVQVVCYFHLCVPQIPLLALPLVFLSSELPSYHDYHYFQTSLPNQCLTTALWRQQHALCVKVYSSLHTCCRHWGQPLFSAAPSNQLLCSLALSRVCVCGYTSSFCT